METGEAQPPSRTILATAGKFLAAVLALLPLAVSLSPADRSPVGALPNRPDPKPGGLVLFDPRTVGELESVLDRVWAEVEPGEVPNVAPASLPPGLDRLPPVRRKDLFVRAVIPHVVAANQGVRAERRSLIALAKRLEQGEPLTEVGTIFLLDLARRYRVKTGAAELREAPEPVVRELLVRVDEVPVPLAVAQAALESAWGTSRFAVEGNALFGQWVFRSDAGMAPRDRPEGARYAVAAFPGLGEAVEGYLRNLNTLWAYEEFRALRARARAKGRDPDPDILAWGLLRYSVRREAYVEEVLAVMRHNRLHRYSGAELVRLSPESVEEALLGVRTAAGERGGSADA
ncbi:MULTISPECIES: glucosaminidase domain-containing protein [Deferrisoma]